MRPRLICLSVRGACAVLLLHKLMEEVLTGELTEEVERFADRARELVAELVLDPDDGDGLPDADEIAATAWRTLQLPDIAALRERLTPNGRSMRCSRVTRTQARSPGASTPSLTTGIAPRWSSTGRATSIRPTRIFASMPVNSKTTSARQARHEVRWST